MIEAIKTAFPACVANDCLSYTEADVVEIFEDEKEKRCYLQKPSTEPVHFTVFNPNEKPITFLAIDQCMLTDADVERCDCALFDEGKILFLELKTGGKRKNRKALVQKAKSQLKTTIKHFSENIDLTKVEKQAIVNVGYSQEQPKLQPGIQAARLKFQEELDTYFDITESTTF